MTRCASVRRVLSVALFVCLSLIADAAEEQPASASAVMTPAQFQAATVTVKAPDHRLTYGDPNQFGELRLPAGAGRHPVAVLIHGGCWMADYATLHDLGPIGDTLKADGIATWNIEYRRLRQPGSGWPGTYLDVGRAIDHLRVLAAPYRLDLSRVVVVGHSAGGHLTMWAATRRKIDRSSPLYVADALPVRAVVNLAGTIDMVENIRHMEESCGPAPVVTDMMGGDPAAVPERYKAVSARTFLPLGVRQLLVWGSREDYVPRPLAEQYAAAAERAGDRVRLMIVPGAGYFEIASTGTAAWPMVHAAIGELFKQQ
jgi:acetyl esterase/lipase